MIDLDSSTPRAEYEAAVAERPTELDLPLGGIKLNSLVLR